MIKIFLQISVLVLSLFLLSPPALGRGEKAGNLKFEGSLGLPNVGIENPDGSSAYYDGLALMGRAVAPVYGIGEFWTSLVANIRYFDLKNTANTSHQKEFANQLGPGVGLRFSLGRLYLGLDYLIVRNRHYAFGGLSRELEYNSSPFSYYIGIEYPLGALSLGLSYAISNGSITTDSTNLNEAAPYTDTLILFTLTWDSGISFGKFASSLIKL